MDDDLKALCKRLEAVRYQREDWHEPYGAIDLPCDADDHGAVAVPRNPDGPEAAKAIRALLSERRKMVEALEEAQGLLIEAQGALVGRDDVCMDDDGNDAIAVWRNKAAALSGSADSGR